MCEYRQIAKTANRNYQRRTRQCSHQREREREQQQFQAKEEIATFLRTNEPLSPLESSHAKFKSCPIIIDAQTGKDEHNF